jgi:stage II sporulation protein P
MKKYPSVKCVFDVHRDAIVDENDNKIKFTTEINGEKVSQIMIVSGSDQLGLSNPHWEENLSLALKIQKALDDKYPGLMRPVNLRKERFNMHKTYGSLIFEVGTHGNTLDEALASIKYFADGIEEVLK